MMTVRRWRLATSGAWALVLVACGARSSLEIVEGAGGSGGSAAPSTTASGEGAGTDGGSSDAGTGGALPFDCGPELTVTAPASLPLSGNAGRVRSAFGSNDGSVVALFADSAIEGGGRALEGVGVEPWATWPPPSGAPFIVEPSGGETFAMTSGAYGAVALLFQHDDVDPAASALRFANALAPTAPSGIVAVDVATLGESPRAIALARGYEVPPIAFNVGYMAMLATWEVQPTPGIHALRMGVGASGVYPLLAGVVTRPDEPDLACASGPIAADAVRLGDAWLVAAGSASGLQHCAAPLDLPTMLAVDRVAWGANDAVDWTLSRASSTEGQGVIVEVKMVADATTAWALVRREQPDALELVHLDASGAVLDVDRDVAEGPQLAGAVARLGEGVLVATVPASEPTTLRLQLRDRAGAVRSRGSVLAPAAVLSPSLLTSMAGDAVVAAWTDGAPSAAVTRLVRIGCASGGAR